ncbi:hypothetical protein ABBQ38_002627 [Trebouxia sp. C0009 RCD-2024]
MPPTGKPAGSGTARMDASKAAQMEEVIKKEQRIQARAEEWQRAAGLLPPEPKLCSYQATKPEPVPEPALMSTVHGDPEAFMTLNLSRNLNQGANPAYQLRDGFQTQSCMKADFNWDQEEIDFMKSQGLLDKTFNRRRDEQSMYMEESCKFKHLMKRAGATAATAKA